MKKRLAALVILIAYSAFLIKILVFKDLPIIRIGSLMLNFGGTQKGPANLIPFRTILPFLLGEKGFIIGGINILGNIVLLVPIGLLVPFVYQHMTRKKTIALALAAGFAIEGMQVFLQVGIFDIDDVILNGLGVMVGYWVFTMLPKLLRSTKSKKIIIASVIGIISSLAVLGMLVYQKTQGPVSFHQAAAIGQAGSADSKGSGYSPNNDPCNGTGGTGQIIAVGKNTITIKRHDGINEIIQLTDQTKIRTATSAIAQSDLKIGDRVTVVVGSMHDEGSTAVAVLVCNSASRQPVK